MLRNILMALGFIVAVLPYIGIPYDVTKWIWTFVGLAIVFLLYFSQKGRSPHTSFWHDSRDIEVGDTARTLQVQHHEREERPEMLIERDVLTETIVDSEGEDEIRVEETKVTTHKRRKKLTERLSSTYEEEVGNE